MRTTITINDKLLKVLKQQALDSDETVSTLIESAVRQQLLEDAADIELAKSRAQEPRYSFDDLVAEFKAEGLL